MVARPEGEQAGGERGILFREILKIPVLMVKTNPIHPIPYGTITELRLRAR